MTSIQDNCRKERAPASAAFRSRGVSLIETLIAAAVFMIAALGAAGFIGNSIAHSADALHRSEAVSRASTLIARIIASVPRQPDGTPVAAALGAFEHQSISSANCSFSGTPSASSVVVDWANSNLAGAYALPGAQRDSLQIVLSPASGADPASVAVTTCWQPPGGNDWRRVEIVGAIL